MADQRARIAAAFNDSTVSMDEPVSAIMLALVLRQIMPSLAIAQVDDMVSAHVTQSVDKATTFRSFLDWLFSEEQLKSMRPAPKVAPKAKAASPEPGEMPEEAQKSWEQLQEQLKARPYLSDPSTGHPLCSFVQACMQSLAEKKYEETAILVERISNSIIEDEKRIASAFKHFDKDGSGVLERQEFKFLCAYLGWSGEESNSIDVNKDGTVSLAELQHFVGYLGGVQKLFEQRRKRTQSHGGVKEVCPIVGAEVGARVRSHFFKNGQKSSSWREAQVLSVNCHTDSGRGILLEFGFEEIEGSSDWVARQVVPVSWILSSHEETSMAMALREVGILDDSQALYNMVYPLSELQSIQGLVGCQRGALALVRQQAILSHQTALEQVKERFQNFGYGDYELEAVLSWVKDMAPLVVHVHLDRMGQFLETDEYYRNQFETKTSCGAIDDGNETRIGWERSLFGDTYEEAKPFDRCKYGALNVTNDYRGVTSAQQYGDSYLVLKDVRLRATFSSTDSGGIEGSRLGVCDRYAHVLQEYNDDEMQEIVRVAMAALPQKENGAPANNVPKSAWPLVLRADSEDCSQEWITVGYPALAAKGSGRYVYEVEFYEDVETPQVGLLSELYQQVLGVRCPTGVGDDAQGWSLDPQHAELWSGGQSRGWQGKRLAPENGGKQFVGVAVDLAERKVWFGVNGAWQEEPGFINLSENLAVYPALSFRGRASFIFKGLCHPPPKSMGTFQAWPKTYQGKFRIDCPKVGNSDILDVYKEFQVHGEVCLKKHVQRLVANNKYRETPKFERSRNVELSKGGHYNGTYLRIGTFNSAPLYHCDDVGWIFYDRPKGRWLLREDKGEGAAANVGDLITAKREEKTQAGTITKALGKDKFEITWADGVQTDQIKMLDDLDVVDGGSGFQSEGGFALEANEDILLTDTAPPVGGWMASPESSGFVDPKDFRSGMEKLGLEMGDEWAKQLLRTSSAGKEVVMRRPSVDVSFDALYEKLGREEDSKTAWEKISEAAFQSYLRSQGFDDQCQLIQTEHPYRAERHSWTKEVNMPNAKGIKFVFSKKCVTYDSCAHLNINAGGIPKRSVGPGMRIEVEGLSGERRFGFVSEVDAEKAGKMVKLDIDKMGDFGVGDEVEVEEDGKWIPCKITEVRSGPLYVVTSDAGEVTCEPERVKLVSRAPREEFAFVLDSDDQKRISVEYRFTRSLPGDEIEGFTLDKSRPMGPVGITGFKKSGYAQQLGMQDWWRLDVVGTMIAWPQRVYDLIGGDGLTKEPMIPDDILMNLDGALKTLNKVLTMSLGDWGDETDLTFHFFNGFTHRLVPEAHITFTGRVGDEIRSFEVREDEAPKISDLGPGLAFSAGVRRGWVLSLDTLTEENAGTKPSITEEQLKNNPEIVLDLTGVTLVFDCEEPDPQNLSCLYGEEFANFETEHNVCQVEFETDGDGSSYPDRRWGIMALAVPIDFKPTGSELAKWRFCSDGPLDDGVGLIHKEPKLDSEKVRQMEPKNLEQLFTVLEEVTCEQGLKWLKLEDGWLCAQWARPKSDYEGVTAEGCDFAVDAELNMLELLEPWDQVMAGASRILQDAAGVADANPLVSREGWDEERLRALCMRHGWEFEWMSEDGERRRRGAERQGLVPLPAFTTKADSHSPDGYESRKS